MPKMQTKWRQTSPEMNLPPQSQRQDRCMPAPHRQISKQQKQQIEREILNFDYTDSPRYTPTNSLQKPDPMTGRPSAFITPAHPATYGLETLCSDL
jgi:hypothetical protein